MVFAKTLIPVRVKGGHMGMFGAKMGYWEVNSIKDPRWNNSGKAQGLICNGGPSIMKDWIKQCRKKYGKPPNDCYKSFHKD